MQDTDKHKLYIAPKPKETPCESCMYFDYDDDAGREVCTIDMDEDDNIMCMLSSSNTRLCPYYRYYNEYKSVQKQN